MLLLKNADVYTPAAAGRADILAAGGRILRIEPGIQLPSAYVDEVDASGLIAVPGFIDGHVHMTGGGGEGGFATRTPELMLSDAIRGGVTTVVGCLGTDGVTRTPAGLLAKAKALDEEGLSTFIYTGHYGVPVQTLTGSIERDLLLIDKVIGVGEVALSDHRSDQPTFDEFARLAAEARRGGILSGKAGVVNVHMGDGRRGLAMLRRIIEETEIPVTQFLPTHIGRNPGALRGGHRVREGRRVRGLHDLHGAGVPRRGRGQVQRGPAAHARRRRRRGQHHVHVRRPGQPAGFRRAGAAAAPRDRPRDEPVRRGAGCGARRGRAARGRAPGHHGQPRAHPETARQGRARTRRRRGHRAARRVQPRRSTASSPGAAG